MTDHQAFFTASGSTAAAVLEHAEATAAAYFAGGPYRLVVGTARPVLQTQALADSAPQIERWEAEVIAHGVLTSDPQGALRDAVLRDVAAALASSDGPGLLAWWLLDWAVEGWTTEQASVAVGARWAPGAAERLELAQAAIAAHPDRRLQRVHAVGCDCSECQAGVTRPAMDAEDLAIARRAGVTA